MTDEAASPNSFWDFSVSVYGRSGVADACLWLQDNCGVDVNMLLFGLFCGWRGKSISAFDYEHMESYVAPWRENVVSQLRAVRRWLKDQRIYERIETDTIRSRVLACELQCEQFQQRLIEARFGVPDGTPDERVAAQNVMQYLNAACVAVSEAALERLCAVLCQTFPPLETSRARALLTQAPPP